MAQNQLDLESCYSLAEINYPKAKQSELINAQSVLNSKIIKTQKYPKIDIDESRVSF